MTRVLVLAANDAYFAVPMERVHQVLRHPLVTRIPLSPAGLIGLDEPPFAVLVTGGEDMVALAAQELPTAADFEEPVGAGAQPGELGVYSTGGHLVVLIDVEELVKNRLDLKRAS